MDNIEPPRRSVGDKVRKAAAEAGILPNDPLAPVVEALADIPAEVDLRIAPVLAEMRAFTAAAQQAAEQPLVTHDQVKTIIVPALLAAFKWSHAIISVRLLLVAVGVGMGIQWWETPALTCQDDRGGVVCWHWKVAPTLPAEAAQTPQSKSATPQTGTARGK